jgi:hypothetical protein
MSVRTVNAGVTYVSVACEKPSNEQDGEGEIRSSALRAVNCVYMKSSASAAEAVTQLYEVVDDGLRRV